MTGDLDLVKQGLKDRMADVCRALLPDGRDEGGLWAAWNPVTNDRKPGRLPTLKVRVRGGDIGAWTDWRGGDKGDALGLVAYVLTGNTRSVKEALAWGRDFLGLKAMSPAERAGMQRTVAERREAEDKAAERRRRDKLLNADRLFNAKPPEAGQENTQPIGSIFCPFGTYALGSGTPVEKHALAYFAARACPLTEVRNVNRYSTRFAPQLEWWKGATWKHLPDGRRVKENPGPMFPAILSAMRNAMGIVTAVHATFLDPARPAKAPVEIPKLMFGEAKGAVVEISTGPSRVPYWQAADDTPAHPLIIGEGRETVQGFAVHVPEARVWMGGSLAGVTGAPVGMDCVSWVLFARDNNHGNAQAQKQFEQALATLEASGKRIVVEASHVGDDFNDLARGEE